MTKNVFIISTVDVNGTLATFQINQDHHAEQILRGLVHSGYAVTIKETTVPLTKEEMEEYKKVQVSTHAEMIAASVPNPTFDPA